MGVAYVGVICESRCLKEGLAWICDIRNIMLLECYTTKEKVVLYALLCGPH